MKNPPRCKDLETNPKRHGRFHQHGIAIRRDAKQRQAAIHHPIGAQLHRAIHAIKARHGIRRCTGRRNGQTRRHLRGIMSNARNARGALAKSLLEAPIKIAPRPFIRGGE